LPRTVHKKGFWKHLFEDKVKTKEQLVSKRPFIQKEKKLHPGKSGYDPKKTAYKHTPQKEEAPTPPRPNKPPEEKTKNPGL
jgi:hypothetical protein